MVEFYYIFNKTKGNKENSKILTSSNSERVTQPSAEDFEEVIRINRWNNGDIIIARGDYGDTIIYVNGNIYNLQELCIYGLDEDLVGLAREIGLRLPKETSSYDYCKAFLKEFGVWSRHWSDYGIADEDIEDGDDQVGGGKIINPLSGRMIQFGGARHKALVRAGYWS